MTEYETLKAHWLKGSKLVSIIEDLPYMSKEMCAVQFKEMFLKEVGIL